MGFNLEITYHCVKDNVVANTLSCTMWNQKLKELDTMAKYHIVVAMRLNLVFFPEELQSILLQACTDPQLAI